VILTNFGSICRNLRDIFQSQGLSTNCWWPWFSVKLTVEKYLNAGFWTSRPKYSPTSLHFKTDSGAETAWRTSWFWPTLARFARTWEKISSPRDSKLTRDRPSFQWNGERKNIWTIDFEFLGQNIAPLHFKTYRLAATALGAPLFWPTLLRFLANWGIFPSLRDSKLIPDGLVIQGNGHR